MDPQHLLDPRLLIVTGKGGVGKSTAAAALALAGVASGRRTCLVEVEGRQTMSRLFSTAPWSFAEQEFRPGLWGLSIDPEASLAEYLDMFYGARRVARLVVGNSAVEFATTAAPGIKDVLLLGKVNEMELRREGSEPVYDLIVVDAPPTGRIVNFLRAPEATLELVPVGPIQNQARRLVRMVRDPARTHLQLVTLLEELPVTETLESVDALTELGVTVGPVIVNRVLDERFDAAARKALEDDLGTDDLGGVLERAGLGLHPDQTAALRELGQGHLRRLDLQQRMHARLTDALGAGLVELPYVYADGFAERELSSLADLLGRVAGTAA